MGCTPNSPVVERGLAASPFGGSLASFRDGRVRIEFSARAKRSFDALMALMLLTAIVPLFLLIAMAIKLDSPGPVFYRVRRVGYRGRSLMMLKFRKMHHDAAGIPLTANADERLTRVERFSRAPDSTSCRNCGTCSADA